LHPSRQRHEAETLTTQAATISNKVTLLRNAADTCPDDADVIAAANEYGSAVTERDRAHTV
jgi:hypothetical protein